MIDRDEAWKILTEYVEDEGLRRHMQAVEACMRHYATKLSDELDADPERWGLAGLLHDFDWEIHPTSEKHPAEGAPILRRRGVPEDVVQAILAHNPEGSGVDAEEPMDYALRACDEITGLVIAAAYVRPHKDVRKLKVKSVKRNWKDKAFCAAVSREEIAEATEDFSDACFGGGLDLWPDHVANVLEAMGDAAEDLHLDGRLAAG